MPRSAAGPFGGGSPLRLVLGGVLLGVVLAGAWLGFRAVQVRDGLQQARSGLTAAVGAVQAGDLQAVAVARREASADVADARAAVGDPVWRVAAAVPLVGRSFAVVRDATIAVGQLVDEVLPPLLAGGAALQDGALLADGQVDLALLGTIAAHVEQAEIALAPAQRQVDAMPARYLPAPIADAREELATTVGTLADGLGRGSRALELAPAMLGADGPRRYFLAVMNNAEVRGPGGLVGAYAVVRTDAGRLSLEQVGTNNDFRTAPAPVVDLGPDFAERYDRHFARSYWSAAVLTPHWPSASRIMAGLWAQQGGGAVDGVLGVDPVAMESILAVTGPAQVSGRSLGADDVVDFVMRDEYAAFPDHSPERKQVLSELAAALYDKVTAGGYGPAAMLAALGEAAGSGHLHVWSARPEEQQVLEPLRAAGALPGEPGAYLHVVSNNAAGNKADYYVRRRVTYERTAPGEAVVTVELSNTVDAASVPPIVIGRLDGPRVAVEPGQTRQLLSVYAGYGQLVRRVLVDGVEVAADLGTEQGHGVGTVVVEIRPSRPTVVTAEVTDPGGVLTYRQQPLVVDDELDLGVPYVVG